MDFNVEGLRNGINHNYTSDQFKEIIIKRTQSKYDEAPVTSEGTGKRPSEFRRIVEDLNLRAELSILENVFIVSALFRHNPDPSTRYLILIDGEISESHKDIVRSLIPEHISILKVVSLNKLTDTTIEHSYLSEWFRREMGNGFSFVDIDFLIYNYQTDKVLLLEEKTTAINSIGYGQLKSYEELLRDITVEKESSLMFLYARESGLDYFICNKETIAPGRNNRIKPNKRGFLINENYVDRFESSQELVDYIKKI